MNFVREVALYPELVEDVVEELLEANIICPNDIKKLKNGDRPRVYNPNILMDLRHEQVKMRSTVTPHRDSSLFNGNRLTEKTTKRLEIDHKQVEKEIEKFKKELESERKKLIELNKISREKNKIVNQKTDQNKTFYQPVPVINVVTQVKAKENNKKKINETDEEGKSMSLIEKGLNYKEKPIEVSGHQPSSIKVQFSSKRCLNDQSTTCPHRINKISKTEAEKNDQVKIENKRKIQMQEKKEDKNQLTPNRIKNLNGTRNNNFLVSKTIDKWKLFVIKKQTTRCTKNEEILRIKRRKYLEKKYWLKWCDFYKNKKHERDEIIKKRNRMEKLDSFFEKLQEVKKDLVKIKKGEPVMTNIINREILTGEQIKEKNKETAVDKNAVFVNRLKAQKSIIQEQKTKLQEQNKLIQELKEQKLKENLQEFHKILQFNIRETVKNCNVKLKPKAKLLTNKVNIISDDKMDKLTDDIFVKRMNERAQERKEKWEVIRMKRQMIEEEKKRQEIEDEERKQEEEEEERRKKLHEKREQKRLKKEMELKRLKEIEKMKRKTQIAKEFYNNYLKNKIIKILKTNVTIRKNHEIESYMYYSKRLVKKLFALWKKETHRLATEKLILAETFYTNKLLLKCWNIWIMFYNDSVQKQQVSEDFYEAKLIEKMFNHWKIFTEEQYIENKEKTDYATNHYHRKLMKKCLKRWIIFPNIKRTFWEEEKRIRKWREKVMEIIPDFNPQLTYGYDDNL